MKLDRRAWERLLTAFAFLFFLFTATFRLTNASLWYDETIEYWYSKILSGPLPFEDSANMYERIVITFQPPLYNVLMYLWLMISDAEWWMRFFGVVMGFAGACAVYLSVKTISRSSVWASCAVLLTACVYPLIYYWQECAEYCLMLGALCWTVYFWIRLIREHSLKNIVCFTLSAVVPVYSQYGAIFPVLALAVSAFVSVLTGKNRQALRQLCIAYAGVLLLAALPLFVFFLQKQMLHQGAGGLSLSGISFENGLLYDMWANLARVIKWNMMPFFGHEPFWMAAALVLVAALIAVCFVGGRFTRSLVLANAVTWLCYYALVKLGVYSYGSFGSRYNIFFIPLWIVTLFEVCFVFVRAIGQKQPTLQKIVLWAAVIALIGFGALGVRRLNTGWVKEDIRGAVQEWYAQDGAEKETLVYYASGSGFSYYASADERCTEDTLSSVAYMPYMRSRPQEEFHAWVETLYGEAWPDELLFVASHTSADLGTIMEMFQSAGYEREDLFHHSDGWLIRLSRAAQP